MKTLPLAVAVVLAVVLTDSRTAVAQSTEARGFVMSPAPAPVTGAFPWGYPPSTPFPSRERPHTGSYPPGPHEGYGYFPEQAALYGRYFPSYTGGYGAYRSIGGPTLGWRRR